MLQTLFFTSGPTDLTKLFMSNDRRGFLKQVGGAAGAAVAIASTTQATTQVVQAAEQRSYVGGKFLLELDGSFAGWLSSFEGGNAVGEVVTEPSAEGSVQKKHIGNVKYEDISVQLGFSMVKGVYDWIKATLDHKYQRKNGAIVSTDYKMQEKTRLEFFDAQLSEIGFPACDASSKDPAYLSLKFSPEYTRRKAGDGSQVIAPIDSKHQKQWLPANFRLSIGGLEQATLKASKVEALTIKQTVAQGVIGDNRDLIREPGKVEFPNLKITLPESHASSFYAWHEDFVVKGNNSDNQEKTAVLEFLSPTQKVMLALEFKGLGVFKMAPVKGEGNQEQVARARAEMYCEQLNFSPKQQPPLLEQ